MPEVIKRMERLMRYFIGLGFSNPAEDGDNPTEIIARHAMRHTVKSYAIQIATRMTGNIMLSKELNLVWTHVYRKELKEGEFGKIRFQIQGNRNKFADFVADTSDLFKGLREGGATL